MIGERLESHGNLPWGALLLLAVGFGLVIVGLIYHNNWFVTGAVLPAALAGSLWFLGRERPLAATFREQGLEIESATEPVLVPYASIQNIKAGGRLADPAGFRKSSCAIAVLHEGGLLRVPSHLNFPAHEVYRFLVERVPDTGGRDVNPVLAEYLERQERYFGPETVGTFRAASRRMRSGRRGYRALCIGMMLAGAVWAALGIAEFVNPYFWAPAGILFVLFGALLYAFSFVEAIRAVKNWKNASLVIGPEGMAMIQGDIQGEVRWPEVLEIRFNAKPGGFSLGQPSVMPGILLRVKGANIVIADIYDRPLRVIHNRILASAYRATAGNVE